MDPQTEATVRLTCFAAVFLVMALAEWLLPRRKLTARKLPRWGSNLALVVLNTVAARFLIPLSAVAAAMSAQTHELGLLNLFSFSVIIKVVLAVAILDFAIYLQHVLFHAIPIFWRLHRVHHADLDLDVTSGLRFHTLEILLSALIKLGVIALLGAPPLAVVIFEVVLNATAMFNHSNVHLPLGLDRVLRLVLVTPDMHRVHHSVDRSETNSNFGFNLPWWDYFFGTYCDQPALGHEQMMIGMAEVRDEQQACRLPGMLTMPFVTLKQPPEEHTKEGGTGGNAEGQAPAEKKRPRRKWFQFSLRTLLLMMLVFGCGLGLLTTAYRDLQEKWKPIRIIERGQVGASIFYLPSPKPKSTWLEKELGLGYPDHPYVVNLHRPQTDQIQALSKLSKLDTVFFNFGPFDTRDHFQGFVAPPKLRTIHLETDFLSEGDALSLQKIPTLANLSFSSRPGLSSTMRAGHKNHFGPLKSAPSLRHLSFSAFHFQAGDLTSLSHQIALKHLSFSSCEGFTDQDLMTVADFPELSWLSMNYCPIDGTGLQTILEGAPKLEVLSLSLSPISDDGLAVISKYSHVSNLHLNSTMITDAGAEHWSRLKNLRLLNLESTSISDLTVIELGKLTQLSSLNLKGTKVTDLGVVELANLPKLEILNLDQTAVTGEGLRAFANLPSLKELRISIALAGSPGLVALVTANPQLKVHFEPIPATAPPIIPPLVATPAAKATTAPKGTSTPAQ